MEFKDDGGTPGYQRTIETTGPMTFRKAFRQMTLVQIIMMALFFGLIVPMLVLFGGAALLTLLHINPG